MEAEMTTNDDLLQNLSETYFEAVGRARRIEAGEEAGDDAAIEAALDKAETAKREAAQLTADTSAGGEVQICILRDLAAVFGDVGEALGGPDERALLSRVVELYGHEAVTP